MHRHFISTLFLFGLCFAASPITNASDNHNTPARTEAEHVIHQLYHHQEYRPTSDLSSRIDFFSAQFLGKPYFLGALGEGESGYFDQTPLFRTDAFDCETYVDTVLALAFANNLSSFEQYIRHIRYRNGQVSFINRNHFTCLDWNKNNQNQGFMLDITSSFKNEKGQAVALIARAVIDKPHWYQHFSANKIRVDTLSSQEQAKRLTLLKQKGHHLQKSLSTLPYIPLTALFDSKGHANKALFDQIPNAAIIEIIRPNWDLHKEIGTHLNVSHLGFSIRKNGTLLFRETSSLDGRAIDISLIDYLRQTLNSPTIKGINVQVVLDQHLSGSASSNHHSTTSSS